MLVSTKTATCQTTNKKTSRKENFCILCKKTIKEFCKHFENVHKDTDEGIQLQKLNKIENKALKKKLKTNITDTLRKQGNAYLSKIRAKESLLSGKNAEVIPVKRSSTESSHINTVQCAHCQGYYQRRKFSQHLTRCQIYIIDQNKTNTQGPVNALAEHSLPVVKHVEGASKQLMKEVISSMKPRETLSVALRDPLLMKYASEFQKSRRETFQRNYVSRIITDLARLLMRMQEVKGGEIRCLEDIFNPAYFTDLVNIILQEGGYDPESGRVETCGISNRLRSHIKGAAQTAKKEASIAEYTNKNNSCTEKRKRIKHFLMTFDDKWANEVGRIFDDAVKKSRSESDKKIASEEDIIKTCQYICSKYRKEIKQLDEAQPGSLEKQKFYNRLLDYLITHIMCLIRRRPVDFKRGQNLHYEKLDKQEDLINEIKNSKYMDISDEDMNVCQQFQIFYVPGKGWKELVPIALTKIMKEAMEAIQRNKQHVGIKSNMLFVRAREMPINPRESIRKVTKNIKLKKPLDLSGNGLRHHAGTFSKLNSSHPQYQDYLASALGHTLHIHKLHYEMPTSILQKLIVMPVLHSLTKPPEERKVDFSSRNVHFVEEELSEKINKNHQTPNKSHKINLQNKSPETSDPESQCSNEDTPVKQKQIKRKRWSEKEKITYI